MLGDGGWVVVQVEYLVDLCFEFGGQGMGGWVEVQCQDLVFCQWLYFELGWVIVGLEVVGIVVVIQVFDIGEQVQGEMLVELVLFLG